MVQRRNREFYGPGITWQEDRGSGNKSGREKERKQLVKTTGNLI